MRAVLTAFAVLLLLAVGAAHASLTTMAAANPERTRLVADHLANVGRAPHTVSSLNVTAYLGRWYQMYADGFVVGTFENSTHCATATYSPDPQDPKKVLVRNWQRNDNVTGPPDIITGYAVQTDPSQYPGRLSVVLHGPPFPAPYWILALGPIVNGQYDWAIVSDDFKLSLFVLTRDKARFASQYEASILAQLHSLGFTGILNTPIKIEQNGCSYIWA